MEQTRRIGGSDFVWDVAKAAANEQKHGICFEDAVTVFADPLFKLVAAGRKDEARYAAIGFDAAARLLYVVHVEVDDDFVRIISARRATRSEEADYAQ